MAAPSATVEVFTGPVAGTSKARGYWQTAGGPATQATGQVSGAVPGPQVPAPSQKVWFSVIVSVHVVAQTVELG
jgi:hypothetical protein